MDKKSICSFAIEGPCCAGKTTLATRLLDVFPGDRVGYVRDYSEHVGGGRFLPNPMPSSLEDEARGLGEFLKYESERVEDAVSGDIHFFLIDRSVYTLYAHCYAIEIISGKRFFKVAQEILDKSPVPLWPDLTFYLDTPTDVMRSRNKGKFPLDSIFIDGVFNAGIRSYFFEAKQESKRPTMWLDATQPPEEISKCAELAIRDVLANEGVVLS